MSNPKKVVSNLFYFFLDFATITLFGYVFWVIMGKLLLPAQYGLLATIIALFYVLLNVSTLGMQETLPKFVPEYIAKNKIKEATAMIRFANKTSFIFSLVFSFLIGLFANKISLFFYGSYQMTIPLQFLSIIIFAGTTSAVFKATLQSLQLFKNMFNADLLSNIFRISFATALAFLGYQAFSGILGLLAGFILFSLVAGFSILKQRIKDYSHFDRKSFMRFSFHSIVTTVSIFLILQSGTIILSVLSGLVDAGLFAVVVIFGQVILFVPTILFGALFPNISELLVKNKGHVSYLISVSLKLIAMTVLPFVILFSIFSDSFIRLLYTESYIGAGLLFPTYLFGAFLWGMSSLLLLVLYVSYKAKTRSVLVGFGAVLFILLSLYLIPQMGILGASSAFLISQIIIFIFSLYLLNKQMPIRFARRSFFILHANTILLLISYLFSIYFINTVFAIVVSLSIYTFILLLSKSLNKTDIGILDYFPDKFGFGFIKKIVKKTVYFFDKI